MKLPNYVHSENRTLRHRTAVHKRLSSFDRKCRKCSRLSKSALISEAFYSTDTVMAHNWDARFADSVDKQVV